MRTLTDEVVATATYNLPSQLDYVHLDWKDVKELSEALNLPAVVSLSLSHNALSSSLLPLRRCTNLWFLNLSHNKLACLDGLQAFSTLGHLDLSYNALKLDELTKLSKVEIIQLSVEGNPPLVRSLGAGYRGGILAAAPSIWVLDGHFASSSEWPTPPPAAPSLPRVEASSFDWRRGTWGGEDAEGGRAEGARAARHLAAIRDQPSKSGPQRDSWRLQHLASTYDLDASTFNGFVQRGNGRPPSLWPLMHLPAVQQLGQFERLDLLALLCADLIYAPPRRVASEALAVLLAPKLGAAGVSDLARLPPFGKTALAFALRQALTDEVSSVPEGPNAMPRDKRELLDATPAVVAKGALGGDHASTATLSRHAVALLARAPSCPSLSSAPAALPPLSQKLLRELAPLLAATGVPKAELSSSSSFSTTSATEVEGSVIEANYESFFLGEPSLSTDIDLSHVRWPRPGERLKWSASVLDSFAYILAVSEDGSSASVAFQKRNQSSSLMVNEEVARNDMYWDPKSKGWVHVAAAAEAQRQFRAAHRPLSRGKKSIGDDFTAAATEMSPPRVTQGNRSKSSPTHLLSAESGIKSTNLKQDRPLSRVPHTSHANRILGQARVILVQQGRDPSSLLEAPSSRPSSMVAQEAGSDEWIALQRDMGSFRECNRDKHGQTSRPRLLDLGAMTDELSARKRSLAKEEDGGGVFELTGVNVEEEDGETEEDAHYDSPNHNMLPEVPHETLPPLAHRHQKERQTVEEEVPMPQLQMRSSKHELELHRHALVPSVRANVMSGGQRRAQPRRPRPNRATFLSISSVESHSDKPQLICREESQVAMDEVDARDGEDERVNSSEVLQHLDSRLARILQRRSDLSGRAPQGLNALLSPIPR